MTSKSNLRKYKIRGTDPEEFALLIRELHEGDVKYYAFCLRSKEGLVVQSYIDTSVAFRGREVHFDSRSVQETRLAPGSLIEKILNSLLRSKGI